MTKTLHIMQASMQFSDSRDQQREDLEDVFTRNADAIAGTEAAQDPLRGLVARVGENHGYQVTLGPGGGWTAVHERHELLTTGYVHVINPVKRPARLGGHAARGIHVARFLVAGVGPVEVLEQHWVTGVHDQAGRREQHERQTKAILERLRKAGQGRRLAFFLGDVNLDLAREWPELWTRPLKAAGATSVYDELELDKLPDTAGRSTLDVIASYDKDTRVKAVKVKAWPRGFSDHRCVSAWYHVRERWNG